VLTCAVPVGCTLLTTRYMDHTEAIRECEGLFQREAQHTDDTAIECEVLVSALPNEKSREIAQLQVKACHRQAERDESAR
jgi:hypothetical protein